MIYKTNIIIFQAKLNESIGQTDKARHLDSIIEKPNDPSNNHLETLKAIIIKIDLLRF